MSLSWKVAALRRLATPGAPRVFGRDELVQWLNEGGVSPPSRTLLRALQEWEAAGLVSRPVRGVYINSRAHPLPLLEETAQVLRPGAVISLASVLGRAGVLNNPSYWITAVLPSTASRAPVEVEGENGAMFRFAHMRPDLIPSRTEAWARDAYVSHSQVPMATAEKALLDWVYLSSSARGAVRWPLPALHDLEMDDLDADRLDRLAQQMDLVDPLAQLRAAIDAEKPRVAVRRSTRRGP